MAELKQNLVQLEQIVAELGQNFALTLTQKTQKSAFEASRMRRLFLNLSNQVDLAVLPLASKILWVETSELGGEHQKAQSNKISDWVRVARIKKATVDIRKGRGFMPLSGFARILSRLWHSDVCSSSLSRLICFL